MKRQLKRYSANAIKDYIATVCEKYGDLLEPFIELEIGLQGVGLTIIKSNCDALYNVVFQEHYETCWTTYITMRRYRILPNKYVQKIREFENENY